MKKALAILFTVFLSISGAFFLSSCNYPFSYSYSDAVMYETYDAEAAMHGSEIATDDLSRLTVDWIAGSVSIEKYDGDTLSFTEKGTSIDKAQQMRWLISNGELDIKYMESGVKVPSLYQKDLVIHVPTGLNFTNIDVKCVSSNLSVSGLNSDNFELKSVSGEVSVSNLVGTTAAINTVSGGISASILDCTQLNFETVSGNIYAEGLTTHTLQTKSTSGHIAINALTVQNKITAKTISGKITCNYTLLPSESQFDSTSGDVNLVFPDNDGFSIQFSSVSGRIRNAFGETDEKGSFSYLNSAKTISVHTISGSCSLQKK